MTTSTEQETAAKRRTWPWALVVALVVAAVAVSGFVASRDPGSGDDKAAGKQPKVATAQVVRTDLAATRTLTGKLGYGSTRKVIDNSGGIITSLPETGTVVTRGDTLYRVDDQAVPVFYGTTPLFRPLDEPGLVGRDVRVIADNLSALGYAIGAQPAVGSRIPQQQSGQGPDQQGHAEQGSSGSAKQASNDATHSSSNGTSGAAGPGGGAKQKSSTNDAPKYAVVHEGDAVLTPALMDAIARWQQDIGLSSTGTLRADSVAILRGASRVAVLVSTVGQQTGGPVLTVSSRDKVVTVPMNATDVGAINVDDKVTVTLPDATQVPGTVTEVSHTVTKEKSAGSAGGATQKRDVIVTLDDAAAAKELDHATVRVGFTSETRKDVLAVPVDALLALAEGGYALQKANGKLVPVKTGLFAKGMVEISGDGVRPGMRVVTAS